MERARWMKSLGSGFILAGVVLLFSLGNPPMATSQDKGVLKIGILIPLTGPSAVTGDHSKRGAILAAEEINAAGGVLGRKIELVFADDESNPAVGVAAAERLITRDQVEILGGTYNSNVCLAVMDVASKYRVPYISGGATSDQIGIKRASDAKKFRAFYKVACPSYVHARLWIWFWEYLFKENLYKPESNNIAIVNENSAWGNAITDAIKKYLGESQLSKQGFKITLADQVPHAETDFLAEVTKVKAQKPAIVFGIFAAVPANSAFQKQYVNAGIKAPVCSPYTPNNPEFIPLTGAAANGLLWGNAMNILSTNEGNHYKEAMLKRFQKDVEIVGAMVYDSVYIIKEAYGRAKSFDKEKLLAEMDKTKRVGVTGVYVFDPNTHEAITGEEFLPSVVYQIQEGKSIIIWPKKYASGQYVVPAWMK